MICEETTTGEYLRLTDRSGIYEVVDMLGGKSWYKNNKLHRENGPAVIAHDGAKLWFKEDKLHREDGPAVISHDGRKRWNLNNIKYSKEEWFKQLTQEQLAIALSNPENF